ncbi:MAG: [acyl-carrier-protein] S-malonyltransferase [Blastocatellia bacterium]|jgi:[acyl-carrier-protein] S-malonyltransferase|nr:[acyl-carrier-protein] S-malonyltransferase [Blastocatellia bacterium]
MSGKLAYIFPGQGSQAPGMGKDLATNFPAAQRVFEEADDALGFSISEMCFEGSAEELQLTENTQPAILTVSVAALRAMEAEGLPQADFVAGHSLGEYSALVAAGAVSLADAVRTVRARGSYMQEATPVGAGAMAAIMGAELSDIMAACGEAQEGDVCQPANINAPGQVVIAGHNGAVERAIELLKARGAKRAIKLKVSAPFHCALMMPAQERLAADLSQIEFADLRVPLVTNVDAALISEGAEARDALTRQVSSPVRWQESMELLLAKGVETLVEVGPGKVLSGLMRQIRREALCLRVEDAESLMTARAALVR